MHKFQFSEPENRVLLVKIQPKLLKKCQFQLFCQLFSPKILRKKIFCHFWTKSSFFCHSVCVRGWSLKTQNPDEDFKLWEKFSVSHLLLSEKKKEIQFPLSFDELEASEQSRHSADAVWSTLYHLQFVKETSASNSLFVQWWNSWRKTP